MMVLKAGVFFKENQSDGRSPDGKGARVNQPFSREKKILAGGGRMEARGDASMPIRRVNTGFLFTRIPAVKPQIMFWFT